MGKPFLERKERNDLVMVVAGLRDFTDEGTRGRRQFLQFADLRSIVSGVNLSGHERTVAGELIYRLERYGELPDRPTYHALGALLEYLLDLEELPPDEKTLAARLVVRYSLIADDALLAELRQRFAIDEPAVRQAQAAAPKSGAPSAPAGPDFEPAIGDEKGLEAIIHSEDNFLDICLLRGALYCAQAVGRVEIPEGMAMGTGFLVGPDLLLTNHHVLEKEELLEEAVVRFDFQMDANKASPREGQVVAIDPDLYRWSAAEALDYALVRLRDKPLAPITAGGELAKGSMAEMLRQGKHRGYLPLAPRILADRARVNILQHPAGAPLKVVLTQNYVVASTETRLQYVADTMEGSSGSPVFNKKWEVVGLHHSGAPYPEEGQAGSAKKAWKGDFRVNEGILMRAILEDFRQQKIDRLLPRG